MDFNFGLNQYQIDSILSQVSLLKYEQDLQLYISSILSKLYSEIDRIPEVSGAGVCYVDSQDNVIEFRSDQLSSKRTSPIYIVLREPPEALTPSMFAAYMKQAQSKPREGKLAKELSGLFFNCFPILLGWVVVGLTSAAIPLTAGASSVLTVTVAAGTIAGAGSCFNSILQELV